MIFNSLYTEAVGPLRLDCWTQRSASKNNKVASVVFVLQVCYGLGRCPEPEDQYYPLQTPVRVHEHASTRPSMLLRYATNTGVDWESLALTKERRQRRNTAD
jgi:hypothetical protein